jgi:para-nitrobenzyl esterase
VATHKSGFPYLFDLPGAPLQGPLGPDQQALAASMRTAWANFTAGGNPASAATGWPAFGADGTQVLSLVAPRPRVETDFAVRHHCAFWDAG